MAEISRRHMLAGLAAAPVLLQAQPAPKLKLSIFSKHLQFLQGEELAAAIEEIGFEGVDLAVRKGGHIEPENVKTELPKLAAIFKKHNIEITMLTTDIVDADSPYAEDLLSTMQKLGIHHYRWAALHWTDAKPYAAQIEEFKPRVAKLAALNRKYQATAMYHTHSGIGLVGASIWDLHEILQGTDPRDCGINYDVGHATIEGGFGGWINSFNICGPHLRGIALKDFVWEKNAKGDWKAMWKPIGEGMVKFPQFLQMVAKAKFQGPLQMHFEYPLGGADAGKLKPTMPKAEILAWMSKDLKKIRGYMATAGL